MERRREKFHHTIVKASPVCEPEMSLDFKVPANITEMQHNDPVLAPFFQKAKKQGHDMEPDINSSEDFFSERWHSLSPAKITGTADGS